MDKQKALQILHLDSGSSFEEVRSAYRIRAKQFHPDRITHDDSSKEKGESRMKDINLAFHTLSGMIGQDSYVKKTNINSNGFYETSIKKNGIAIILSFFCSFFCKILKKNHFKSDAGHQNQYQSEHKTRAKRPYSQGKGNYIKCYNYDNIKNNRRKIHNFNTVLKKTLKQEFQWEIENNSAVKKSNNSPLIENKYPRNRIKLNTYFAGNQRMKRKKRFMDTYPGPVEKILPVPPVTKIT